MLMGTYKVRGDLHIKHISYLPPSLPPRALGSKPSWVKQLAQALLRVQDANVVVVDWVYGASFAYNLVVENYKEVAVQISVLINQLQVRAYSFVYVYILINAISMFTDQQQIKLKVMKIKEV